MLPAPRNVRHVGLTVVLGAALVGAALLAPRPAAADEPAEDEPAEDEPAEDEAPEDEPAEGVGPLNLPLPTPGPAPVYTSGAGASMGVGAYAYDPAPTLGPRVHLPALEIALAPPGFDGQVRLRTPVLGTLYHAAAMRLLHVELDVMVLATGGCDCPLGNHVLRPLVGPLFGFRLSARPHHALAGGAVGARLGVEYLAPRREVGVFIALEPVVEVWGGLVGANSQTVLVGGGAVVQFGVTGYKRQPALGEAK